MLGLIGSMLGLRLRSVVETSVAEMINFVTQTSSDANGLQ